MSTDFALADRQSELTRRLIVSAAVDLLTEAPVEILSTKTIAGRAGMSERTVFRHYNVRETLLDAVAAELCKRLEIPREPATVDELLDYPARLFGQFERRSALARAALRSELYDRVRKLVRERRGASIDRIIDAAAPEATPAERRRAAANIQYHLVASCWDYFRSHFGLSSADTIECSRVAIRQTLIGLGVLLEPRGV